MWKRVSANIVLLVASLIFSLMVVELTLRLAYPRYADAASVQYSRDTVRIWSPRPDRRSESTHPDSGLGHPVIYNHLALRHSRNFKNLGTPPTSRSSAIPTPSTSVCQFNTSSQAKYNVFNFGVNGYGTDQSYLNYLDFGGAQNLHHVFYVLCANDLRNIYESNLFSIGPDGTLVRNPPPKPRWWISALARLHVTYLVLDVRQRLLYTRDADLAAYREMFEATTMREQHLQRFDTPQAHELQQGILNQQFNDDARRTLAVFSALLEAWNRSVEANGGRFSVVLLPTGREDLLTPFIPDGIEVISLYKLFSETIPGFTYEQIHFRENHHWNEKGNMLAAAAMYRILHSRLGLPAADDEELKSALIAYYAAFGGWMPDGERSHGPHQRAEAAAGIRQRYLALELGSEKS